MVATPDGSERGTGLDRRQLLKAGAWAAPVVLLAATAPAASASPNIQLKITEFVAWYTWDGAVKMGVTGSLHIQATGDEGTSLQGITVSITTTAVGLLPTTPTMEVGASEWQSAPGVPSGENVIFLFTLVGPLGPTGGAGLTFHLFGNEQLHGAAVKSLTAHASSTTPPRGDSRDATAVRATSPEDPIPPHLAI